MSNLTRNTYLLLRRIADLNPNSTTIGMGMLATIIGEAKEALEWEDAPRFRVLSGEYDFTKNEIVSVKDMSPTRYNGFTVEARAVNCGAVARIPDAELCPLE